MKITLVPRRVVEYRNYYSVEVVRGDMESKLVLYRKSRMAHMMCDLLMLHQCYSRTPDKRSLLEREVATWKEIPTGWSIDGFMELYEEDGVDFTSRIMEVNVVHWDAEGVRHELDMYVED